MNFYLKQKVFTWGDTYEIRIASGIDAINALAVVLIIDASISSD